MSTSLTATIMEILESIFGDAAARAEFLEDPDGYLAEHGLEDLSCVDFDEALVSFFENKPVDVSGGEGSGGHYNLGGRFEYTVPQPGQSDHEAVAEHLTKIVHEYGDTYITNNDNDVVNDASFHGTVVADGDVTFDDDITSTVASGDGAIAAGQDVTDASTGDIDATDSGINFGGGSANGGDDTTDNSVHDSHDDNSDNSATDSYNDNSDDSDSSVSTEYTDSYNDNSDRSDDSDNSSDGDVEVRESTVDLDI